MIKDILILQKRELEKKLKEKYIERIEKTIDIDNPLIKVIIGPRRAGKSFFVLHFLNKKSNFGYANFDDEKLVDVKDYNEILVAINSIYDNPKYIFFDEIQNLDKWELFVNRLQRGGFNLILTGSNSNLLSRELATHLTGRHILIQIFPFSFKEFLKVKSEALTTAEIKEKLDNYALYGGYPEPLVHNLDYKEYLSTLFNSIIYKDIIKRYRIRFPSIIEDLSFYLLSNIAKEHSYNSIKNAINTNSVHTVKKYLDYLKESFLFFSLNRFSYKVKGQLASNKKIYCIDNGFIYAKAFKLSPDRGKLYENLVANELRRREVLDNLDIYYWKNAQQEEVDFLIKKRLKVEQLIQVCFDIEDQEVKNREVRALLKASKELKCKNLLVITKDYENKEGVTWFGIRGKIEFIPLWKWLLNY